MIKLAAPCDLRWAPPRLGKGHPSSAPRRSDPPLTELAPLSPRGRGADDPHPNFEKGWCHFLNVRDGDEPTFDGAALQRRGCAVTGRLSNERRPTEPPRPRYRGSPSRSGRSYLSAPPSPVSTNGAQTVDGRTRVGFSDRASPSQLGAVPRPGRLSGRSSVRQGAEFDGRDRGDRPMRHEDRPGTGVKKALASAGQGAPYPIHSRRD
jgi:hypothetical protein